jgi:O-antigen ligase
MLSLLATAMAAVLGSGSNKVLVAGLGGVAMLPVFLWLRGPARIASMLVFGIALTVPVNLDFNLFVRNHVGGAPSITVSLTVLGFVLFYIVWAHRTATGVQARTFAIHRPITIAAITLLAVTPISLVNAADSTLVALEWVRLLCLVMSMLAVMSLQEERLVRLWIVALSVQVVIQACLAAMQYFLKRSLGLSMFGEEALVEQNIGYVVNRATGTIGHPNILSYFFEIMLPIMWGLALTRQRVLYRWWFALACGAGIVGIMTTLSRGSWLTLPVSFTIVFVMVYGRRIVRVKSAAGGFLLGCGVLVALYFAYPTIEKRFTHTDYKSSASRAPLNRAAWSIVEQFPVAGVGLNNFAESFKVYDTTGNSRIFRGYRHVVHNLYLWIWAETGTIGLIAYLMPFLVTIWVAWRCAPRAPPVPRAILAGAGAGLLAHLLHGMVDPGFRVSLSVSFLIFTMMGVVGALAMRYPPRRKA